MKRKMGMSLLSLVLVAGLFSTTALAAETSDPSIVNDDTVIQSQEAAELASATGENAVATVVVDEKTTNYSITEPTKLIVQENVNLTGTGDAFTINADTELVFEEGASLTLSGYTNGFVVSEANVTSANMIITAASQMDVFRLKTGGKLTLSGNSIITGSGKDGTTNRALVLESGQGQAIELAGNATLAAHNFYRGLETGGAKNYTIKGASVDSSTFDFQNNTVGMALSYFDQNANYESCKLDVSNCVENGIFMRQDNAAILGLYFNGVDIQCVNAEDTSGIAIRFHAGPFQFNNSSMTIDGSNTTGLWIYDGWDASRTGSGIYNSTITVKNVTGNDGYHVADVKVNGESVGAVTTYTFKNIQANGTIEVTFARNSTGGGGGGGGTVSYIITASAADGGKIDPNGKVSVTYNSDKTFTITPDRGYHIADVLVDGKSVGVVTTYKFENIKANHTIEAVFKQNNAVADPADTGVADWLNTSDHIKYLHGYDTGAFGPGRNMTRAEVAQMFYNLLLNKNVATTVSFTDVAEDAWYAKAVNTLASIGVVKGVGDDQFAPERAITRAEFTVIAMRFAELDSSGENIFTDVSKDDWFYAQVVGSIKYGWISGYGDGTFRPNNTITRAEVTAITNRMLGRAADEDYVDAHAGVLHQFPDVDKNYWAYYSIMEATNAHDYRNSDGTEDWTGLKG